MMTAAGNIFEHVHRIAADEEFTELVTAEAVRIERIVSTEQASPPGFWYDQPAGALWIGGPSVRGRIHSQRAETRGLPADSGR
jgi:hypothetical protein